MSAFKGGLNSKMTLKNRKLGDENKTLLGVVKNDPKNRTSFMHDPLRYWPRVSVNLDFGPKPKCGFGRTLLRQQKKWPFLLMLFMLT